MSDPQPHWGTLDEGRCSNCGHIFGAQCTVCGREILCGSWSIRCPREGCRERVISEEYGGARRDLQGGPPEEPRWHATSAT